MKATGGEPSRQKKITMLEPAGKEAYDVFDPAVSVHHVREKKRLRNEI